MRDELQNRGVFLVDPRLVTTKIITCTLTPYSERKMSIHVLGMENVSVRRLQAGLGRNYYPSFQAQKYCFVVLCCGRVSWRLEGWRAGRSW